MVASQCWPTVTAAVIGNQMAQPPISELNDIILPEPTSWWPLGPAWYVIAILFLIALIWFVQFQLRRRTLMKAKKEALKLLSELQQEPHPQKAVKAINQILKRVALAYAHRESVAALSGEAWVTQLNKWAKADNQISLEFPALAYKPKCSAANADLYLNQAIVWVKTSSLTNPKGVRLDKHKESHRV